MRADRFYSTMVLFILALLAYLTYQIFQPFLTSIAWAIVFCIIFYPVYVFGLRYIRLKALASLMTLILIIIVIIGPVSYIGFAIINEITDLMHRPEASMETVKKVIEGKKIAGILDRITPYFGFEGISAEKIIIDNIRKFGGSIVDKMSSGFANVLGVAADFVFMAFAIFFFFKDGPDFLDKIRDFLPFSEKHKDRLTSQVKDMIVSTIYGGVIVAIAQGILGGLAFYLLGIRSPVLWGGAMALTSFIPMFGTSIIWLPASLILFLEGAYLKGIALVLIGIFVISMVDNILKPLIIGGRTKMPTIVIFFSVLGGLKVFGLLGLVMGPLVFALFISVFEIFKTIEGEQ